MRKGFTLTELMIVIAIIAILAAIAVPNLLRSRVLANEAAAVSILKQYASAQVTFQIGKQGRDSLNTLAGAKGFADNFTNLVYGEQAGQAGDRLHLLSIAVAGSALGGSAGAVWPGQTANNPAPSRAPLDEASAYQGYHFMEPEMSGTPDYFQHGFSLYAVPFNSSHSGANAYFIGSESSVRLKALGQNRVAAVVYSADCPANPDAAGLVTSHGWTTL